MEFIKGDPEKLTGTTIVYSEVKIPESTESFSESPSVLAFFASTDPLIFSERLGIPEEMRARMKDDAKKDLGGIEQKLGDKIHQEVKVFPFYAAPYSYDPVIDSERDEDIVYMGKWNHPMNCLNAMHLGLQLYIMRYGEQAIDKLGVKMDSLREKPKEELVTYGQIPSESFMAYVSQKYVGPMIDARRRSNYKEFDKLKLDFLRFSMGSPFVGDAKMIAEVVFARGGENGPLPVVHDLVLKMNSILKEDYVEAARLRDKIKAELGKSTS